MKRLPFGGQDQAVGLLLVDQLLTHGGSTLKRGFDEQLLAGVAELEDLIPGRVLSERGTQEAWTKLQPKQRKKTWEEKCCPTCR